MPPDRRPITPRRGPADNCDNSTEDPDIRLINGGCTHQHSEIILTSTGPVVRVNHEYKLKNVLTGKYASILAKYDNNSSTRTAVVDIPLHFDGTYMFMFQHKLGDGSLSPESAKKWAMVRSYRELGFNSEFVPVADKVFVPACMAQSRDNTSGQAMVVPDAKLRAPEGYRYVVIMRSDTRALHLFGVRDSDCRVFLLPVPNISFESGKLCEGTALNTKFRSLLATSTDAKDFINEVIKAWEAAQWNSDLIDSLPTAVARNFLRWDINGKHLADARVWDDLAQAYGRRNNCGTDMYTNLAIISAYMRTTNHVICS